MKNIATEENLQLIQTWVDSHEWEHRQKSMDEFRNNVILFENATAWVHDYKIVTANKKDTLIVTYFAEDGEDTVEKTVEYVLHTYE